MAIRLLGVLVLGTVKSLKINSDWVIERNAHSGARRYDHLFSFAIEGITHPTNRAHS